jgi:hypothetical protein
LDISEEGEWNSLSVGLIEMDVALTSPFDSDGVAIPFQKANTAVEDIRVLEHIHCE